MERESNIKLVDSIANDNPHLEIVTISDLFEEYENMVRGYIIPAVFISIVLLLIAIANYINVTIVNIIAKRKEYAIMKGIGLTSKQYRTLILSEGLTYIKSAAVITCILGTLFNFTIVKSFIESSWVTTYNYWPLLTLPLISLLYIVLLVPVPLMVNKIINKKSVVEGIRE